MDLCVYGGTGFIGRHLCEMLHARRIRAFACSRTFSSEFFANHAPSIGWISADDPSLWGKLKETKAVVYLGSASIPGLNWRSPDHEIESNLLPAVQMFRRLLDENPSCRIFYTSSGGQIYGKGHTKPISEDALVAPCTSYGLGKHLVEQALAFFHNLDGASITVFRLANPVGRWQMIGRHGFVSAAIMAAIERRPLTIYGDGRNLRDYFDVDEFANLITQLAGSDNAFPGGCYNIGSGIGYTERDVVSMVESILSHPLEIRYEPSRPFDLNYSVLDCRKSADRLGFVAESNLQSIIEKFIRSLEVRTTSAPMNEGFRFS